MAKRSGFRFTIYCLGVVALTLVSCSPKTPTTKADRLKWSLAALNGSYDSFGSKNAKWDQDAQEALTEYARARSASDDDAELLLELVGDSSASAIQAGCDDPMIRYLYVKYADTPKAKPLKNRQELYRTAATTLAGSGYSPLWKFYGHVDAAEILWQQRDTNRWPEVREFRSQAVANLNLALQDPNLPEREAFQAANQLFELLARNTYELTNAYNTLAATLASHGAKPVVAQMIKAGFYVKYAWRARGNGTADQVTEEGWRLFHDRLSIAEDALADAWSHDPFDPEIPTLMISVILGQQKPRAEMETWFARAMKVAPNSYSACRAKLHYLKPQWYGSREAMLEFGRECVTTTNWGGHVPLILVDAHSDFARLLDTDERKAYWRLPDVWPDIKAAYEKFAQTNPEATRFRYPYAAYAYRCGQWQDFLEQVRIIRQTDIPPHYRYFGGQAAFDQLVEQASHPAATKPDR